MALTPRQEWFKKRVDDCLAELQILNNSQDWNTYRREAFDLAHEIMYATSEWNKYYKDVDIP